MGIHDREYYRGETRGAGWLSPMSACKAIILINIGVFLFEQFKFVNPGDFRSWFAATSDGIFRHGQVWQLLTATFLHSDLIHLVVNMYFLWIVGREMESMYGQREFYILYIGAAIVSTLGWAAVDAFAVARHSIPGEMIGASGAIFAIVVLFTLTYPRRELLFMFVIPVQMWLLVSIYIAYDLLTMLSGVVTQTAVASHLTGAAYGYLYHTFDLRWSKLSQSMRLRRRPRLRIVSADVPREKPVVKPSGSSNASGHTWATNSASLSKPLASAVLPEEQLDVKLDEILAKIAREGRGSLDDDENRVLQEASLRARNRRSDRP